MGPGITPPTIKRLILWTCVISISSAFIQSFFDQFQIFPGPQYILSLSWWGLKQWFIWEPLSFLFVQYTPPGGISFSFVVALFFNMYLLWIIGSSILEMIGKRSFLLLYFISGITAGLITLLTMPMTGNYQEIAGSTPAILALLTVWCMAFPEAHIFLFFLIPIKAKWLVAGLIGAILLISFSNQEYAYLILYISAILVGYGYAALAWGWHSPFEFTQKFDSWLAQQGLYWRRHMPSLRRSTKTKEKREEKIIDLRTGLPPENEDAFVDAMLTKISKYGESSLSRSERQRLKEISERKMQKK